MPATFSRAEILDRLSAEIAARRSILVVGAGNGLSARCAEEGGADLAVVYNSGHFRVNGLPSFVGNLPVGDANGIMLRLGRENIQPRRRSIPIIAGVYGVDPTRHMEDLLDEVEAIGYSGVINFPGVERVEGPIRREMEAAGMGYAKECDMIRQAHDRGLFTLAYCYAPQSARLMTEAGVDVVVGHMGLTRGGDIGAATPQTLEQAVEGLHAIFDAAKAVRSDVLLLAHGGPVSSATDVEYVNAHTAAVGFVGASSFERIPIEQALKKACLDFKSAKIGG